MRIAATSILFCAMVQGANVTWTGAVNSDFAVDGNWSTGTVPAQGDVVYVHSGTADLRNDTGSNYDAVRVTAGALNLSGGTLRATAHPAWDSWVGADMGKIGTVNQTSGTADFNELELGRNSGSTGVYNLSGGDLGGRRAQAGLLQRGSHL